MPYRCAVGEVCAEAKNKSMADHNRWIALGWAVYWSGVRNSLDYVKVTHTHAWDRLERNRHPFASAVGPVKPKYNKALCCHTSLFISSNNVWKVTKQTKQSFFFWKQKIDILKNVGSHWFHGIFFHMSIAIVCLFFCSKQKK